MKHIPKILLIVCVLITGGLTAQNTSVTYEKQELADNPKEVLYGYQEFETIFSSDSNYYYQHNLKKSSGSAIVIMKISHRGDNVIWEKTIPPKAYSSRMLFCSLQKSDSGFIVFSAKKDSKTKDYALEAQYLDEDFKIIGERKVILQSIKKINTGLLNIFAFKVQKSGDFFVVNVTYLKYFRDDPFENFTLNNPVKYYSIQNRNVNYDFRSSPSKPVYYSPAITTLYVLDKSLNLVWEKKATLPETELYTMEQVYIDKNANLTAIFKTRLDYGEIGIVSFEKQKSNQFFIVNYNHQKQLIQTIPYTKDKLFEYHGNDGFIFDSINNKLNIFGQYYTLPKKDGYEGCYFMQYNLENMELIKSDNISYNGNFLKTIAAGQKSYQKEPLTFDYHIKTAITHPNGEYTIIFAKDYIGALRNICYFENIIIARMTTSGKIKWGRQIPRKSSTLYLYTGEYTNFEYLTSYAFNINDTTYLLLNADSDSGFEKEDGFELNFTRSEIIAVKILGYDQNGDLVVNEEIKQEIKQETKKEKGIKRYCELDKTIKTSNNKLRLTFQETNSKYKRIGGINAVVEFK